LQLATIEKRTTLSYFISDRVCRSIGISGRVFATETIDFGLIIHSYDKPNTLKLVFVAILLNIHSAF